MKRLLNTVFILFVLFFSSCSGKLSRGSAETIIKEYYQFPIIENKTFDGAVSINQCKDLKDMGLVVRDYEYVSLTTKGKNTRII
jgi:hypothetical protein